MQVIAEALPLTPLVEVIGLKCLKLEDLLKKKKIRTCSNLLKKKKLHPKQKYIFVGFILWKDKVRRQYNKTFLF